MNAKGFTLIETIVVLVLTGLLAAVAGGHPQAAPAPTGTAVVTDSTCDLPRELLDRYAIRTVPLRLFLDDEEYVDKVSISADEFNRRLPSSRSARTSQPAPADFRTVYEEVLATHAQVASLHVTAMYSGTHQSAATVARMVSPHIAAVDCRTLTVGLGLVVLEADGRLWKIMGEPDFQLDESFIYAPVRVAVDGAGRVFVVSKNVNYGMVELDKDGNFRSFYGAIQVTSSLSDLLWRRIATKAQREKMLQNVPTEYSSNAVDGDGFIYGTISTQSADQFIKKMNPMGSDVLRRMGSVDPNGDIELPDADEKPVRSVLTDICVGRGGVYSVLDTRQGRVFTYDNDGNLLYVFGALGNRNGCFVQPSVVDVLPDGTFLVADSGLNQILRFYPTEYAQKINAAVGYQYNRDYASAEASWMEVLKYTAKSELAFNEIGKAYYRQEAYTAAMKYFKLSGDRTQYSKAYKEYRRQVLNDSFSTVMTCLSVLAAGIVVLVCVRRRKGRKAGRGGVDR